MAKKSKQRRASGAQGTEVIRRTRQVKKEMGFFPLAKLGKRIRQKTAEDFARENKESLAHLVGLPSRPPPKGTSRKTERAARVKAATPKKKTPTW